MLALHKGRINLKKRNSIRIFKKTGKLILYLSVSFVAFVFFFVLSIRFPFVQARLVPFVEDLLTDQLGVEVGIGNVYIDLLAHIELKEVAVYDQQSQKCIGIENAEIDMISTSLWRWVSSSGKAQNLSVDHIKLEKAEFNLYRQRRDSVMNIDFLIPESSDSTGLPIFMNLDVKKLELKDSKFTFVDSLQADSNLLAIDKKLNYSNLHFHDINADIALHLEENLCALANIRNLSLKEKHSKFRLDSLSVIWEVDTVVKISDYPIFDDSGNVVKTEEVREVIPHMYFKNLLLKTTKTRLLVDIMLKDEWWTTLFNSEFDEKFDANFRHSIFDFETLNYFLPDDVPLNGAVGISGFVKGSEKKLKSKLLKLNFGGNSAINTDIRLTDYTKGSKIFIEAELDSSKVNLVDLKNLLPIVEFPQLVENVGTAEMNGRFIGFPFDFVTQGNLKTPIGSAILDLNMKIDTGNGEISYEGKFQTREFDLNQLLNDGSSISNNLNLNATAKGYSLNFDRMKAKFEIQLFPSNITKETIDSATAKIEIKEKTIKGPLNIFDKQGNMSCNIDISFADSLPKYYLVGDISKLNLNHYTGIPDSLFLTSIYNIDLVGNKPDDIIGNFRLFESYLYRPKIDTLKLKKTKIKIRENTNNKKNITVNTSYINIDLSGNFNLNKGINSITELSKQIQLFFLNNDSLTNEHYMQKDTAVHALNFNLKVETYPELNEFLDYLGLNYYFEDKSKLIVDVQTGKTEFIDILMISDSLALEELSFKKFYLSSNIAGDPFTNTFLANAEILINEFRPNKEFVFNDIEFLPVWDSEKIEFELDMEQKDYDNAVLLTGQVFFLPEGISTSINSRSSVLTINNENWHFQYDNKILLHDSKIDISDFAILNKQQMVSINGTISKNPKDELSVVAMSYQLGNIFDIIKEKYPFDGIIDAKIKLRNLYKQPQIDLEGKVSEFSYNETKMGDILLKTTWDQAKEAIDVSADLLHQKEKVFQLLGVYQYGDKNSPLDFNLYSYNFPLKLLGGFVNDFLYDLEGEMEIDSLRITGKFDSLNVQGLGHFENAQFGVDYLKTKYHFTGDIVFTKHSVLFPEIILFDQNNHTALLDGGIYHNSFQKMKFDIQLLDINNFLVLNTTEKDNELFYGTAYIKNGIGVLSGSLNEMKFEGTMENGPGTAINIPLNDYVEGSRLDFVHFINTGDTISDEVLNDFAGFEMNLSLIVNEDAGFQLIFDEKVGDIISGQGNGTINMQINTAGDFNMFGNFTINAGKYLFTSQNVVNKNFMVDPGGTITWDGDPYDAKVNLTAKYLVKADISDLVDGVASRRVPVEVLMHMKGSLLAPNITLSIDLPNVTEDEAIQVISRLRTIQNDEQELNKQVFSLLTFQRFAPTGSFLADNSASSGVTSSISELISSQVNHLLGGAFGDNIDFSLNPEDDGVDAVIKARLFKNRLTFERDGTLVASKNNSLTVGNIRLTFRVLPVEKPDAGSTKGVLAVEVFNRENQNISQIVNNTTGIGIFYKKDFDNLLDLFRSKKNKKKKKKVDK